MLKSATAEEILLEEKMFRITVRTPVVTMRAWRDPNVPRGETERMARAAMQTLSVAIARTDVSGIVMDMRHAPPMFGPESEMFFATIFKSWARAGRRVTVVPGEDAIQTILFRQLLKTHAGMYGALHTDAVVAYRWARDAANGAS